MAPGWGDFLVTILEMEKMNLGLRAATVGSASVSQGSETLRIRELSSNCQARIVFMGYTRWFPASLPEIKISLILSEGLLGLFTTLP